MRRILAGALLGTMLSLPAMAEIGVKEILVRKKGPDVNVRVTVDNPGGPARKGPIKVTLFIRPDSGAQWEQIKVWTNIAKVGAGEKVSRDFFEENNAKLRKVAENPAFEVKAVLQAAGLKEISKVTVYGDSETGK